MSCQPLSPIITPQSGVSADGHGFALVLELGPVNMLFNAKQRRVHELWEMRPNFTILAIKRPALNPNRDVALVSVDD